MSALVCPCCRRPHSPIMGITRTGARYFRCDRCGHRWDLAEEDKLLGYVGRQVPIAEASDAASGTRPPHSRASDE